MPLDLLGAWRLFGRHQRWLISRPTILGGRSGHNPSELLSLETAASLSPQAPRSTEGFFLCRTLPAFRFKWSVTITSVSGLSPEEGRGHLQRPCAQQLISPGEPTGSPNPPQTVEDKGRVVFGVLFWALGRKRPQQQDSWSKLVLSGNQSSVTSGDWRPLSLRGLPLTHLRPEDSTQ